jgi:3-dehydroquinate synthase
MVVEAHLAMTHRHLSSDTYQKIHDLIQRLGFELAVPSISESKFLSALTRDKKVKKGEVRFVVPTDIGQTKVISGITEAAIIDSIQSCLGEVFA